jgi:hypothetical protein
LGKAIQAIAAADANHEPTSALVFHNLAQNRDRVLVHVAFGLGSMKTLGLFEVRGAARRFAVDSSLYKSRVKEICLKYPPRFSGAGYAGVDAVLRRRADAGPPPATSASGQVGAMRGVE